MLWHVCTLVLDLDETLVHCSTTHVPNPDRVFQVTLNGQIFDVRAQRERGRERQGPREEGPGGGRREAGSCRICIPHIPHINAHVDPSLAGLPRVVFVCYALLCRFT